MIYPNSRGLERCDKQIKGMAPKHFPMWCLVPPQESLASSRPAPRPLPLDHWQVDLLNMLRGGDFQQPFLTTLIVGLFDHIDIVK